MTESVTPPADSNAPAPDTTASTEQTNAGTNNNAGDQQPAGDHLTAEQIKEYQDYKKFIDSNGGFEAIKRNISAPKNAPEPTQKSADEPQTQQTVNEPAQQPQAFQKPSEGQIGMEALLVQQYMNNLASDPKYASIADDIRNGNLMKEMSEGAVPIFPVSNGAINDSQIRWYLDMKAAGAAAQQTSAEPTSTPTVDYVPINEVKTYDDAAKIILQNQSLRAAGLPEHEKTKEAKEFMKNYLNKKK